MIGDEKFLEMRLGDLLHCLGINMMPVPSHLWAYNSNIQYSPSRSFSIYVPRKHVGKDADPQHEHLIVDSTYIWPTEKALGECVHLLQFSISSPAEPSPIFFVL